MSRRFSRRSWPLAVVILTAIVAVATATAAAPPPPSPNPNEFAPVAGPDGIVTDRQIPGGQNSSNLPSTFAPRPAPLAVTGTGGELGTHFTGLNFHNQRRDADGGNQFSLEPPDQGLCAGNGYVVEPINDIFKVYDTSGAETSPLVSMNQFFFNEHEIDRTVNPPIRGTFMSDPKCLYDPQNGGHFFLSILTITQNPLDGTLGPPAKIWIATSKTNTPTTTSTDWYFTSLDVTNDGQNGTPAHPGCPCYGDQPLLGADANGVYVTTNEFPINGPGFNGAQIYAFQKSALELGTTPNVVRIEGFPITPNYGEGIPYSLQPTTSPTSGDFAAGKNGTEYLLGALEFGKKPFQLDNRIAVWALTNTATLNSTPALGISTKVISSQVYGFPGDITQPNGPTPLATFGKNHENLLAGGDDRMQVAVYANGKLWGAGDTIVKTPTGGTQVGVTYYVVSPSVTGTATSPVVDGTVSKQGYLSVSGNSVTRPSLAVTTAGKAVIGVSLIGPHDFFPSAAYATLNQSTLATTLHVVAAGAKPADGFSGYSIPSLGIACPNCGVERWGDYGAAAADGSSIWVANEWIQGNVGFGIGGFGDLANWNTFVSKVTPP